MLKSIQIVCITALVLMAGCGSSTVSSSQSESTETPTETSASSAEDATSTDTQSTASAEETTKQAIAEQLPDTLVIPGERIGPVTASTSRAELAEIFGEERLTDEDVYVGEGFTEPGTHVELGPEYSFKIIWADDSRSAPLEVRELGSAWTTPQGIGMGTSFSELRDKLGSFDLYGFAWDYGGTVVLDETALADYSEYLVLRVQPTDAVQQDTSDYQAVTGESVYKSENPHFEALDLRVSDMIVVLNVPGA
ncbi:MAG TPA: hypothetical protein ACFE0H_09315 [Elainellaceae cyanobacterium]